MKKMEILGQGKDSRLVVHKDGCPNGYGQFKFESGKFWFAAATDPGFLYKAELSLNAWVAEYGTEFVAALNALVSATLGVPEAKFGQKPGKPNKKDAIKAEINKLENENTKVRSEVAKNEALVKFWQDELKKV